jgi:PAS domain-containing protein
VTDFLGALREELLDGLERHERTPAWREALSPRGRRWGAPAARRFAAVAVGVAAAIAVAVEVADRAAEVERSTTPEVARLEGFHATGAVAAYGDLWVTQYDIDSVLRIDLPSGKLGARIDVGASPAGIVAGAGAIWAHDWERGRLLKLDPRGSRVVATVDVGTTNSDVAFAAGAVWSVDERGSLVRVDPDSAEVTRRVPLGAGAALPTDPPSGAVLAAAGDVLWVVSGDGHVTQVDARTGDIVGRARGPALPLEKSRRAVADESGLWISSPVRRDLVHIDARTRRVTHFPVPGDPGPIASVDGRVWVGTLHDSGALTRVTVLERDGRVAETVPVPNLVGNIVPARGGGAWTTFGENETLSPAALLVPDP